MISSLFSKRRLVWALYLFLVILSLGLGMGVPFFTILLGLVVGWFLPPYLMLPQEPSRVSIRKTLRSAALSATVSLVLLGAIWLPALSWLFDPTRDPAQFGMPLILFEPLASFLGWIILMVLVSPFLQFLLTVFAGLVRLVYFWEGEP